MALSEIQLKPKETGSGGLWGKILGGIVGAVGGAFAGGPGGAVAGGISGAGAGMGAGGAIGEAIDPRESKDIKGPSMLANASKENPGVQIRQTMNLLEDVRKAPDLDEQKKQEVFAMGAPILDALKRRV